MINSILNFYKSLRGHVPFDVFANLYVSDKSLDILRLIIREVIYDNIIFQLLEVLSIGRNESTRQPSPVLGLQGEQAGI